MIVKQRPAAVTQRMVFSVGGGVALLLLAAVAFKWSMSTTDIAGCRERYERGVVFSLARRSGEVLTPAQLQERMGFDEWGLSDNVRVITTGDEGTPHALEIAMKADGQSPDSKAERRSGLGFLWESRALDQALSTCLSYRVWVPAGFKFDQGGRLPGLRGGAPGQLDREGPKGARHFGVHMVWLRDGTLALSMQSQAAAQPVLQRLGKNEAKLATGRWIEIDQEVGLNNHGVADGSLRIWVDGKLRMERNDITWRGTTGQRWIGVVGDTYHTSPIGEWAPPRASSMLRLTPFELRVQ